MKKRMFAILLTIIMLFSMTTVALADETVGIAPISAELPTQSIPGQFIAMVPNFEAEIQVPTAVPVAPVPIASLPVPGAGAGTLAPGQVIALPMPVAAQPLQVIGTVPNFSGAAVPTGSGFTPSSRLPYTNMRARIMQHRQVNPDVVGWLRVPGTNIDVPIVQTTLQNGNEWYNTRNWQRVNFPGRTWRNFAYTSTFLDVRNVTGSTWASGSRNTVLYGHNWTNLTRPFDIGMNNDHVMFGQLPSFTDVNFARANPHIYYSNINNEGIWRVFAVASVEVHPNFNYNAPNMSQEQLGAVINEWRARSVLNFGVDVNSTDRILTLSTCIREFQAFGEHQRFVVVARLLRPGESEHDAVTVTVNPNPRAPGRPWR